MLKIKLGVILLLLLPRLVVAADYEFQGVQQILQQSAAADAIHPYSINLESSRQVLGKAAIKRGAVKKGELVYVTRVKVNSQLYYRLVIGNLASNKAATQRLAEVKRWYPGAWINKRNKRERLSLKNAFAAQGKTAQRPALPARKPLTAKATSRKPKAAKSAAKSNPEFAEQLLKKARNLFIDHNYSRVLAITDKVDEIGTAEQRETALEMSGLAQERRGKLAQAVAVYNEFLRRFPESEQTEKIQGRLDGLLTMHQEPKARLADPSKSSSADDWYVFGSFSQFYRKDVLDIKSFASQDISDLLVSDLNLFARKKNEHDSYEIQFDGGLINNRLSDRDDGRISRAVVNYTNDLAKLQISGGRQSRTATGIYQRFDGIVVNSIFTHRINFSLYAGSPVDSSIDSFDSEQTFYGGSLNFSVNPRLDIDVFLLQQEVADLTDRQAIGSELHFHADNGFFYGIVDYDLYFKDINNLTTVGNYRYSEQLTLNVTLNYLNNPLISAQNAIQGLAVNSVEELQTLHNLSEQQIKQLAEDRTRRVSNLIVSTSYLIDNQRQLQLDLGLSSISKSQATAATSTLAAVAAIPASDSVYLSAAYSISGLFAEQDFTTLGLKLSDTETARIFSLSGRTRIPANSRKLFYVPQMRVDLRHNSATDSDQYVLQPNFQLIYKPNKKLSIETIISVEYSQEELANGSKDEQTINSLSLGLIYLF